MFRRIVVQLWTLAASLASSHALAEGSVSFEEADKFLKEAKDIRDHLFATLCISAGGSGARLAGEYPLGGMRIGPYEFEARPKGADVSKTFTLKINTYKFAYDRDDRPITADWVSRLNEVYRIEEKFTSVSIEPLKGRVRTHPLKSINCPDDPSG